MDSLGLVILKKLKQADLSRQLLFTTGMSQWTIFQCQQRNFLATAIRVSETFS